MPTPSGSFLKLEIPQPLQWNIMGLEETLFKGKSKSNWRNVINCTNFDPTRLLSSWTTSGRFRVAGGLHYTCTSGFIESKWCIFEDFQLHHTMLNVWGKNISQKPPTFKTCNLFSALEVAGLVWGNTQNKRILKKHGELFHTWSKYLFASD